MVAPARPDGLDVIIRIHDPTRLDELGRALFSVLLADHHPLHIHIVCQRFTPSNLQSVRDLAAPLAAIPGNVPVTVLNRPNPEPADARAALLNLGLAAAPHRYAAFLDYDDLVYPEAYRLLIAELQSSGAAIAFGGVLNTTMARDGLVPYATDKRRVFKGDGLRQLLHSNFCPLHSFVLDRTRIAEPDLVFDETLAALEDYDLLLRLCARYPSSFALKDTIIAEYLLKDDGSNMNPLAANIAADPAWERAKAEVWPRKAGHLLTPEVQAQLGIHHPGLTTAGYLERYPFL